MYETILVRHGLMLVGQTMAGKTRLRKSLRLALEKRTLAPTSKASSRGR